eukprot:866608-Prymnesium_polylepis.1
MVLWKSVAFGLSVVAMAHAPESKNVHINPERSIMQLVARSSMLFPSGSISAYALDQYSEETYVSNDVGSRPTAEWNEARMESTHLGTSSSGWLET